jgi:lauroyl/myristoyl acyltransferase
VTICRPIEPDSGLASKKDQAIQMMIEVNEVFEQWIRERPEQWLCTKRAWAKDLLRQEVARASEVQGLPLKGPAVGS